MKRISAILALIVAVVATSCVQPFELTQPLQVDSFKLTLPKSGISYNNVTYVQVRATGPWVATLETEKEGEIWCWLEDYYLQTKKDAAGNAVKDEDGNTIYEKVYVAKGLETFENSEKYCKVQGHEGITFLPLGYMDNMGSYRYAVCSVDRTDIDMEPLVIYITQSK